ncbi:PD-(D/E)XK nuclease family protein [Phormidium sp. FACHB-1136]|uniref:PD-(D/E)XK nuclease family protein n=1 Tax=Phormidium sp. FACHB-1136 TaxID=2692848 RepID=UPI0016869502|nr:PD-(D/E)XK nuclease family protein [Phormidium sp. FACHB-1136]MBD2428971.1 PD-(D/E)XK nuclease family protein [Phormidium sp. FACHB-1136]
MALFKQLLKLHKGNVPLEDFFTEIVAYVLCENKDLLFSWLNYSHVLESSNYVEACVVTQKTYKHPVTGDEKRPDIVIELSNGESYDLVFIESKIGSSEGYNQLPDYAEILDSLTGYRYKHLVYITRNFEPKTESYVFQNISQSDVKFQQLRWHQFYQFLLTQPDSELKQEITTFMKEYQMAQNNQFSSSNILALANFPSALELMDQVMWERLVHEFEKVSEDRRSLAYRKREAFMRMRQYGHYTMGNWMPQGKMASNLGFFLKTTDISEYPILGLEILVAPNSPTRVEITKKMKEICIQYNWKSYNLDVPGVWSGISWKKSIRDFLATEDHVASIENFLLESLDEWRTIRQSYPELPWVAASDNDIESVQEP